MSVADTIRPVGSVNALSGALPGALAASDVAGSEMHALIARLYPLCRSLTGNGVRRTLRIIGERIPLEIHEVPTGTRVFDWTVPREWNVRDAWVEAPTGERVIDFRASNLHVLGYSVPVRARVSLAELRKHLYSLPEHPSWIPYRTSYWEERWGFCVAHEVLERLPEGDYEVCIDAELEEGSLTYGECVVAGESTDEVLIHAHVCHPSLCNDNLSGIAVATALAQRLAASLPRLTYRFLFLPGTIGAITWLALNEDRLGSIRHGLVLSNLGDAARLTYKRSRRGNAAIDRAVEHVLWHGGANQVLDFTPYGYDERQYCSPGIDLPVGVLCRSVYGTFPEYHTSADDLTFVRPVALSDSLAVCEEIVEVLEYNRPFVNLSPKGEPQLGRRGLYASLGGAPDAPAMQQALLWVLNFSDGEHDLLWIAERAELPFTTMRRAAELLFEAGLLAPAGRRAAVSSRGLAVARGPEVSEVA